MSDFPWTCPYCQRATTIVDEKLSSSRHWFDNGNKDGIMILDTNVIICPNKDCREYVIEADLYKGKWAVHKPVPQGDAVFIQRLKPRSNARSFPDYIPKAIREDYEEACLIASLSPKASATLSRRCLQGIIRDFWGIQKARLIDEIEALQDKIDATTWQAIDAVRSIGNIGAHMEKDINVIVDVDPAEADLLVQLIEELIQEWYVRRYEKEERLKKVIATAKSKVVAKQGNAQ
jgi:hypothetical protein